MPKLCYRCKEAINHVKIILSENFNFHNEWAHVKPHFISNVTKRDLWKRDERKKSSIKVEQLSKKWRRMKILKVNLKAVDSYSPRLYSTRVWARFVFHPDETHCWQIPVMKTEASDRTWLPTQHNTTLIEKLMKMNSECSHLTVIIVRWKNLLLSFLVKTHWLK